MQPSAIALMVAAAVAIGLLLGLFIDEESLMQHRITALPRLRLVVKDVSAAQTHPYRVLGSSSWPASVWGQNCSNTSQLSTGQQVMCQLPSAWKNCSQGIYLDIGTNVGVQIRKLYHPQQFPKAGVLGLYNSTYGANRSGVCVLGVEANPVHTPYLTKLNDYFADKGYQALILTETAAAIHAGKVTLHQDHGSPVEWGASLTAGTWQRKSGNTSNEAIITSLDLPAFMARIVRPLIMQIERETGKRPPVGMKMDVEGEEYALLPALITNGGLCDLTMIYLEPHRLEFRDADGKAVNMTIPALDQAFSNMRKANPWCTVQYSHLDDESYFDTSKEIPLPL